MLDRIKQIKYYRKLKKLIIIDKELIMRLAVVKFLCMIIALIPPYVYQYYINEVVTSSNIKNLSYVISGYILVFIFQAVVLSEAKSIETKYINQVKIHTKEIVLKKIQRIKYSTYEKYTITDLRMRAEEDVEVVSTFFLEHCIMFSISIVYSICIIIILMILNKYLALFGCLMIVVSYFVTRVLAVHIRNVSKKYRTDQSDFDSTMYNTLQNWKEVKLNSIEENQVRILTEKWAKLSASKLKYTKYNFLHGALVAFNLFFVTRMNLYLFGGVLVLYEYMTVPTILVFMNYYERLYDNIQVILNSIVGLGSEIPRIDNLLSLLEEREEDPTDDDIKIDTLEGDLVVTNLSFDYGLVKKVLNNISLKIQRNHSYTIIGESGAGKTTLLKLLIGLYNPTEGAIYINKHKLNSIPDNVRSRYINIVMQDPQFFNMSILDNIRLADENADITKINDVCKKANIYDFIQSLPDKYETIIGENGIKLSGGQRQRLAIARTLLLEPKILIFDEATSALDGENERLIVESIENISKCITVIVISHRYSTIANCESAFYLNNGEIIECGLLQELEEKKGIISELFGQELIKGGKNE